MVDTLKAFIAEFQKAAIGPESSQLRKIAAGEIEIAELTPSEEGGKVSVDFTVQGPQPPEQDFTLVLERAADGTVKATLQEKQGAVVAKIAKPKPIECLDGQITDRRGFQILGPEGWRTFDQDERLLMVMSTDAQPLIGTMKELSQRLIKSRAPALAFERVLPVERLRVANTKQSLDTTAKGATPATILDRTIQAFNTEAGGS